MSRRHAGGKPLVPLKVIIDTDIGDDIDDAIAIAYAARRPELDIRAVTTVYGPVKMRAKIVSKLLHVLGRDDIPFASGAGRPLGPIADEHRLSLAPNQLPFVKETDSLRAPACATAEELLVRAIEAHPNEIWLVTIGAMTNAALLIQKHPRTAAKLKGIVSMGGETRLLLAEYNIQCDPDAAQIVLRSGLMRFLGTLDVTRRIVVREKDMAALRKADTPPCRALIEMTDLWKPHQSSKVRPVVYDMCPLLWLYAPQHFKTQPTGVAVELQGTLTRGMTVPVKEGPPIAVSCDVDRKAVLDELVHTLAG
jgi:purine nucleosidase/pyrimidine-specific ribonucleoside hydrolase